MCQSVVTIMRDFQWAMSAWLVRAKKALEIVSYDVVSTTIADPGTPLRMREAAAAVDSQMGRPSFMSCGAWAVPADTVRSRGLSAVVSPDAAQTARAASTRFSTKGIVKCADRGGPPPKTTIASICTFRTSRRASGRVSVDILLLLLCVKKCLFSDASNTSVTIDTTTRGRHHKCCNAPRFSLFSNIFLTTKKKNSSPMYDEENRKKSESCCQRRYEMRLGIMVLVSTSTSSAAVAFFSPVVSPRPVVGRQMMGESEIDALVLRRCELRRGKFFEQADEILLELNEAGVKVIDGKDGGSQWRLEADVAALPDVLALAKRAREATILEASDAAAAKIAGKCAREAKSALKNRTFLPATHLPGRRSADAAFQFAMAGCGDEELFDRLADCAKREAERAYGKSSSSWKGVRMNALQALEKLAAAGVPRTHDVFKNYSSDEHQTSLLQEASETFYFSGRSKLWRFRYSMSPEARGVASESSDLLEALAKTKGPLVVDLGCGLGASALGLAKTYPDFQVLGVDTLASCIRPARAAAERLGIKNCKFLGATAENVLQAVYDTKRPCAMILFQFPTPFAFVERHKLVRGDQPFIFDAKILKLAAQCLDTPVDLFLADDTIAAPRGCIYFVSNVEDVAVAALDIAREDDSPVDVHSRDRGGGILFDDDNDASTASSSSEDNDNAEEKSKPRRRVPLREQRWADTAPRRRARGPDWLRSSPFPPIAASETEAYLQHERQPVHRLIFLPR